MGNGKLYQPSTPPKPPCPLGRRVWEYAAAGNITGGEGELNSLLTRLHGVTGFNSNDVRRWYEQFLPWSRQVRREKRLDRRVREHASVMGQYPFPVAITYE